MGSRLPKSAKSNFSKNARDVSTTDKRAVTVVIVYVN